MSDIQHIRKVTREKADLHYGGRIDGWKKGVYLFAKHTRWFRRWVHSVIDGGALTWKYGRVVRSKASVGLARQIVQQLVSAIQFGLPPDEYYQYSLYNDFDRARQYVSKKTWGRMLEVLLAKQGVDEGAILNDKQISARHFRQHDLPTIPTLAEFVGGEIIPRDWDGRSALPAADLFSKPVDASQGKGARRWLIQPDGRYETEEGERIARAELLQCLREQSQKRAILLQRRVANHPHLRALTGPALAAIRILTMREPDCNAEYLTGLISLPLGNVVGSNARFGVIWSAINVETGQLAVSYEKDPARVMEPITVHPVTGHRIEGFQLPYWHEAVTLATQAHDTLPNIALIGWDIGVTADGPVIIEGNRTPTAYGPQVALKLPIGATRFPEMYMANFQHVYGGSPKLK